MKFAVPVAVVAVFVMAFNSANASLVVAPSSVEDSVPNSGNDFNSALMALSFDSIVAGTITATTAGTVTFYYHASESGWNNEFLANGGVGANSVSFTESANKSWDPIGIQIGSISISAGELLDLAFVSNNGPLHGIGSAEFGIFSNLAIGSFFSDADDPLGGRMYFGHDDDGAGPDDNHDDIIVSARFTAVPEANSLFVWSILGLMGSIVTYRHLARQPATAS